MGEIGEMGEKGGGADDIQRPALSPKPSTDEMVRCNMSSSVGVLGIRWGDKDSPALPSIDIRECAVSVIGNWSAPTVHSFKAHIIITSGKAGVGGGPGRKAR